MTLKQKTQEKGQHKPILAINVAFKILSILGISTKIIAANIK